MLLAVEDKLELLEASQPEPSVGEILVHQEVVALENSIEKIRGLAVEDGGE